MLRAGHATHAYSPRTRRAAGSRGTLLSIGVPRTGRSSPGLSRRKLARTNTAMPRRTSEARSARGGALHARTHARTRPTQRKAARALRHAAAPSGMAGTASSFRQCTGKTATTLAMYKGLNNFRAGGDGLLGVHDLNCVMRRP